MSVKTTRLLKRLLAVTFLWIGLVLATNGIEDVSLNGTPSDGFSYTDQIPPHQNGAHTRRLQATLQITIVKGQYYKTVLNKDSLQIAFVSSNTSWRSVRCDLWGSKNSKASLSDMKIVWSWSVCHSPLDIYKFPYDGSYYFRIVGDPAYSFRNVMASSRWIIDTEAPRTVLLSSIFPCRARSCVRFTFFGMDTNGISKYECRVNYRHWFRCRSPYTFKVRGKTNSKNIFHVRAIDQAGNVDPSPALYSWTLGADRSATGTQSSNTVPSYHPVDSHEDGDDSGNSSGSFPMMVVYIVAPIVGVVILAGLVVLIQRALLKRRLNRAQAYP